MPHVNAHRRASLQFFTLNRVPKFRRNYPRLRTLNTDWVWKMCNFWPSSSVSQTIRDANYLEHSQKKTWSIEWRSAVDRRLPLKVISTTGTSTHLRRDIPSSANLITSIGCHAEPLFDLLCLNWKSAKGHSLSVRVVSVHNYLANILKR